ncbi:hypothetical protein P8605_42265, partial [Streptomyces sp. T-3]|nr:hypothetical protein [Streptomyces sp. T-3]
GTWSEPAVRTPSAAAPAGPDDGSWELWLHALPDSGLVVELEIPYTTVQLRLLDRMDGLPRELGDLVGGAVDAPFNPAAALHVDTWGNASLVATTVQIPVGEEHA